jgi:hydrogenase maturation protein HypF
VAWDGAGLGLDGTIWGGEFFVVDNNCFERVAWLRPFALPGGELAMRDCSRPAAGLLWHALGPTKARQQIEPQFAAILEHQINAPQSSSVGRLFDAVAYLAGSSQRNLFEGYAALTFEGSIGQTRTDESYAIEETNGIGDWSSLVAAVQWDRKRKIGLGMISAKFHNALANWILAVARTNGVSNVALSGGVFQNAYLTRRSRMLLEADGFNVFTHSQVPANDGGLALGQAVLAGTIH